MMGLNQARGGEWEDSDNDGDAELQTDHADFGGGDAKNIGSATADDMTTGRNSFIRWGDQEDTRIETSNSNERMNFHVNGQKFLDLAQDGGNSDVRLNKPLRTNGIVEDVDTCRYNPQDVRNISSPAQSWVAYHDGSGTVPAVLCEFDGNNWKPLGAVSFSYTGDGTTGRTIASDFQFEEVRVEEGGGTAVDAYAGGLSDGALSGGSFSGELTVESTGGFTVGDNGGDADPNTDTETYEVYAQ